MGWKIIKILRNLSLKLGLSGLSKLIYSDIFYPLFYHRYQNTNTCKIKIGEIDLEFSTKDRYSKRYFFPSCEYGAFREGGAIKFIIQELKKNPRATFIDIGSHVGYYTCLASKSHPYGRVFAFEMDSHVFELLKNNLRLNQCQNVTVENVAAANFERETTYFRATPWPDPSLKLDLLPVKGKNRTAVMTVSIDNYLYGKQVDDPIVKIDVEGAELLVLKGMDNLLQNENVKLFVELHPQGCRSFGYPSDEVVKFLFERGFNVHEITNFRTANGNSHLRELGKNVLIKHNKMIYASR